MSWAVGSAPLAGVGARDPGHVALLFAFELEKVVVAAMLLGGVFAAGRGAGGVNGAAASLGVEELANAAEVLIGFALQAVLPAVRHFGKALLGRCEIQGEMLRQPFHVPPGDRDHGVGAAEAGAFGAVVAGHKGIREVAHAVSSRRWGLLHELRCIRSGLYTALAGLMSRGLGWRWVESYGI